MYNSKGQFPLLLLSLELRVAALWQVGNLDIFLGVAAFGSTAFGMIVAVVLEVSLRSGIWVSRRLDVDGESLGLSPSVVGLLLLMMMFNWTQDTVFVFDYFGVDFAAEIRVIDTVFIDVKTFDLDQMYWRHQTIIVGLSQYETWDALLRLFPWLIGVGWLQVQVLVRLEPSCGQLDVYSWLILYYIVLFFRCMFQKCMFKG